MLWRRLVASQARSITAAAFVVAAASLVSRILGVLRDRVLASEFGAGVELDIYYAAFRIPDMIYNLIVIGALSAGFIPVLAKFKDHKEQAWALVSASIYWLSIIITGLAVICALSMPWLVAALTPGFDSATQAVVVWMSFVMLLSPLLLGVSGVLGSVLQTYQQFFLYSLGPILYNVGIIFGALFLVPYLGLYGLAVGVVLGALLHLLINVPGIYLLGYRFTWRARNHPALRQIVSLTVPRFAGLLVNQLQLFVLTVIGSTLAAGSIAVYSLANNLQGFALGVFAIPLAIAAFPTLAATASNRQQFIATVATTTRQIIFFIVPATVILIILRAQIVRIALGAGRFDWADTIMTLNALLIFGLSLCAQALTALFIRSYFALHNSRVPLIIGSITALVTILLAWQYAAWYGVVGLVLGFTVGQWIQTLLLVVGLWITLRGFDGMRTARSTAAILVAGMVMGITMQWAKFFFEPITGTSTLVGLVLQATWSCCIGLLVYIAACYLLRVSELHIMVDGLRRRFRKHEPVPAAEPVDTD